MSFIRRSSLRPPRSRRGQSLVEFGLILPVMLLMTLGVIDAARVFTAQIALTNGVREAALFAGESQGNPGNYNWWCTDPTMKALLPAISVRCPTQQAVAVTPQGKLVLAPADATGHKLPDANNLAYRIDTETSGMEPQKIEMLAPWCTVSTAPDAPIVDCGAPGAFVHVKAFYPVTVLTPVLSQIWGGSITISATTTAKILR